MSLDPAMKKDKKPPTHFAVCLNNEGYQASLEIGKMYRVIPDDDATANSLIRIVDENGKDHTYPADRFRPVKLPQAAGES